MARLTTYEETFGSASRKNRTTHRHRIERAKHAILLRNGVLTPEQEEKLREEGCIRCRRSNEDCLAREGAQLTIEHFPPQRWLKHWGRGSKPVGQPSGLGQSILFVEFKVTAMSLHSL